MERSPCIGIQMRLPWYFGTVIVLDYGSKNKNPTQKGHNLYLPPKENLKNPDPEDQDLNVKLSKGISKNNG